MPISSVCSRTRTSLTRNRAIAIRCPSSCSSAAETHSTPIPVWSISRKMLSDKKNPNPVSTGTCQLLLRSVLLG